MKSAPAHVVSIGLRALVRIMFTSAVVDNIPLEGSLLTFRTKYGFRPASVAARPPQV